MINIMLFIIIVFQLDRIEKVTEEKIRLLRRQNDLLEGILLKE